MDDHTDMEQRFEKGKTKGKQNLWTLYIRQTPPAVNKL